MTDGQVLLYFCGSTLLTFLIAAIILVFFWKDRMSQFAGCFAIKPVIAYVSSFVIWWNFYYWWHPKLYVWYIIHFIIETCLLLAIIVLFRDVYRGSTQLVRLTVGLDLLRWGSILFLFLEFGLFSNSEITDIAFYFLLYFPVMYAVSAFVFAITRHKKLASIQAN
jgi:hypothetical protein